MKYSNREGDDYRVSQTFLSRRRTPEVDGILSGPVLQVESPAVVRYRIMAISECDKRLDPTSAYSFFYDLEYSRSGILI